MDADTRVVKVVPHFDISIYICGAIYKCFSYIAHMKLVDFQWKSTWRAILSDISTWNKWRDVKMTDQFSKSGTGLFIFFEVVIMVRSKGRGTKRGVINSRHKGGVTCYSNWQHLEGLDDALAGMKMKERNTSACVHCLSQHCS